MVNPTSGGSRGATEKTWNKVQQMFTLGQIVTEVMCKFYIGISLIFQLLMIVWLYMASSN